MSDTIHLANCTAQNFRFHYRIAYAADGQQATPAMRRGVRPFDVGPWRGEPLKLPDGAIGEVIKQLDAFGALAESDLAGGQALRARGVVPVLYSVTGPVSMKARTEVMNHNRGVRTEQGKDFRQTAAIASSEHLMSELRSQGIPEEQLPPGVTVDFEQDAASETEDTGRLTEGYEVQLKARPGEGPRGGGRGGGRGKGKAATRLAA